jgi:hypothetical protein
VTLLELVSGAAPAHQATRGRRVRNSDRSEGAFRGGDGPRAGLRVYRMGWGFPAVGWPPRPAAGAPVPGAAPGCLCDRGWRAPMAVYGLVTRVAETRRPGSVGAWSACAL